MSKRLPQILTHEQAQALLALPNRRYPTGRRNRALLALLYLPACLRISEALALKVRDVNLEQGAVRVWRGKGAKDRTVYLDALTSEIVRSWLEVRPNGSETLLCTLQGAQVSAGYARGLLARLGEKLDLGWRLHPHTLRHSGASELLRRGLTIADVQRVLGHANIATTSVYLHVHDNDLAAKIANLGNEKEIT